MAWPGLAWPGRFVFLTNGASQPHALPFLSCPDCPVPRARVTPGEAQGQHTQQDTGQQVTWPRVPNGQILRQPLWVARPHWDGGCQLVRPGALRQEHCWGEQSPGSLRGLWATQPEPAGRKGEGVGLRKGIREEGRGKRKQKESVDVLPLFLSTYMWAPHPGSLVKAPP